MEVVEKLMFVIILVFIMLNIFIMVIFVSEEKGFFKLYFFS